MEAASLLDLPDPPRCDECERLRELLQSCSEQLVEAQDNVNSLTSVVAAQERKIQGLRKKVREETIRASDDVKAVYEHWVNECVQDKDKGKCKLGPATQKLIAKWLNYFSVDDLCKAIDGIARFPFSVPVEGGKFRERRHVGKPEYRSTKLKSILWDEHAIQRNMDRADQPIPSVRDRVEEIAPRVVSNFDRKRADDEDFFSPHHGTLDRLIRVLGERSYEVRGPVRPGEWLAQCPCHEDRNPSLSLTEKEDGKVLAYCHSCNVSLPDVLRSLGLIS